MSAATTKPSKVRQGCLGCLGLIGLTLMCGLIGTWYDSYKLSRLPEVDRTATIAARTAEIAAVFATRPPMPTSAGGSGASAPKATKVVEPGMEENPAGVETPVFFDDSSWVVGMVKDHGSTIPSGNQFIQSPTTSGRFIEVNVGIRNNGSDSMSVMSPKLVDSNGREFDTSSDVFMLIDTQYQCVFETINPGLEKTCVWIFDVPSDASGLRLAVSGGLFGGKRYIRVNP
jgi:hypothetical protein